jgi:hypothetical protein
VKRLAFLLLVPFGAACSRAAVPVAVPASSAAPASSSAQPASVAPASSGAADELFHPPPDTHEQDATLPAGSVSVELRDADGQPRPHASVFLAQISGTPAPDVVGTTDDAGRLTLSAPGWIGTRARVVARSAGAIFFTSPFSIPARGGVRATLHAYESSKSLRDAKIVFLVTVLLELDGADLHVTEGLTAHALGRVAWLPTGIELALPDGFTHFESSTESDTSLDLLLQGNRAVMSGTIPPGQNDFTMSWRLPLRDSAATLRVPMPPHVALVRLVTYSGPATHLQADGFPTAQVQPTSSVGPILVVERKLKPGDSPLREVVMEVRAPVVRPKP